MKKLLLFMFGTMLNFAAYGQSNLPPCQGSNVTKWDNCFGTEHSRYFNYVGPYKDGKWHGQGTYTGPLFEYVGQFKGGTRHGQGVATFADGSPSQEGIWADNKFVGAEKINPPSQQTDQALNEKRSRLDEAQNTQSNLPPCQGDEVRKWHDCFGKANRMGQTYAGEFKKGERNGQGTYTQRDGDKYVGGFKDGEENGQGTYYYLANNQWKGGKYVGNFKDGKKNGQGTYTSANGVVEEGIWEKGIFVRAEKINPTNQQTDLALNEERRRLEAAQNTQSNLPPCPKVDYSIKTDRERFAKWHNCWGRYKVEFAEGFKGEVLEGEWRNGTLNGQGTLTFANGDKYAGEIKDGQRNGQGINTFANGAKYVGQFKDDKYYGQGTFTFGDGNKYVGDYKDSNRHGQGTFTFADGRVQEGIWAEDKFVRAEKINPPSQRTDLVLNEERRRLEADRQAVAEDRRRLDEERRNREQAKQSSRLAIQANATVPDANGFVVITIQTNADTSSLKINGEEQGGKPDGNYSVSKVARVGQETRYTIVALDSNGNTDTKTVAVTRQAASTDIIYAALNPVNIKQQPSRDAVAIIIGIQNYKRVAKAPYANDDARAFYDYAIRALGIKPQNIKLLVDEEADEIEIIQAFENWLPVHVNKNKTEVYVFYAGHGLPSPDGKSLYFLPYGVDKQYLARTAVGQKEVIAALAASKPKTVTMFIDACYSGSTRSGEILVADARPVNLKIEQGIYPPNFTVISASANDQISSSSPELKHGIFSFYLMKGMEGDADGNKDGKITVGEMQEYLSDKVSRQAMTKNAQQDTQLVGDATRVLVTR
jgi:hypothetical protein